MWNIYWILTFFFIQFFFFKKVDIPSILTPTKEEYRKEWFISPLGNEGFVNLPLWVPFASAIPAFLIFIVLFMEVELTGYVQCVFKF